MQWQCAVPLAGIADCRAATTHHATGCALHLAQHAVEQGRLAAAHLTYDRHKLAGPHLHIEVVQAKQASVLAVVDFLFRFIGSQQVLHLGRTVGVESVVFFSVVAVATLPFVLAVDYAYRTVREMIVLIHNAMDLLQAEEVIESFERRFGLDPIADQIRELDTHRDSDQ
jgi:hypothetical protein